MNWLNKSEAVSILIWASYASCRNTTRHCVPMASFATLIQKRRLAALKPTPLSLYITSAPPSQPSRRISRTINLLRPLNAVNTITSKSSHLSVFNQHNKLPAETRNSTSKQKLARFFFQIFFLLLPPFGFLFFCFPPLRLSATPSSR